MNLPEVQTKIFSNVLKFLLFSHRIRVISKEKKAFTKIQCPNIFKFARIYVNRGVSVLPSPVSYAYAYSHLQSYLTPNLYYKYAGR